VYKAYTTIEIPAAQQLAENKIKGLSKIPNQNTPVAIKMCADQTAAHLRTFVGVLDDKAERIMLEGNKLARDEERRKVFNGEWVPTLTTAIPAAASVDCNLYNGKHFGGDRSAAQYLGRFTNRKLVKALEEKAIQADFLSATLFRFNEQIGHDGTAGPNSPMTRCIRVDSVGSNQHSHPIAETGEGFTETSHDSYIKKDIIKCHNENDIDSLMDVAKYLRTIGAARGEYSLSQSERAKLSKAHPFLKCLYWNPEG
jgi:hypothetical protein